VERLTFKKKIGEGHLGETSTRQMPITLLRRKSKNSCKIYYAAEAFKGRAKIKAETSFIYWL